MPPQERVMVSQSRSASTKSFDGNEAPILAASRHLLKANGSILGSEVARAIEPFYPTLASAIPINLSRSGVPTTALASIDGRQPISHVRIHDFCVNYFGPTLHRLGFGRGHRVALVLPNGPELALCIVATANWASCVPLSANGAASELEADLQRCGADLVIGPYSGDLLDVHARGSVRAPPPDKRFCVLDNSSKDNALQDYKVFAPIQESAKKLGIPFVGLVPSPYEAGIFRLVLTATSLVSPLPCHFEDVDSDFSATETMDHIHPLREGVVDKQRNEARNEVLVLFTSGTTGNKKLVPHQLGDMLTAATTIALSWDLTPDDVNCNLMPLFHGKSNVK